ncbi:MAG: Amidase [Candidatus Solibacter sp.]|nr:Amidase [Candidatus Solibacter sp.]
MLRQWIRWLESGEKQPGELLALCLRRIAEQDGELRAWVAVAPQPALGDGPLDGIPFGVKDIFDTRDLPTEFGSPLYGGRRPDCDARVVDDLRHAGAVLLGKTQTTAFASFDPAPTRNPRLPGHTPGGSSAGSAAAVAAGMVPFAIGSQTLGSVLRPASFCGVCGFKPSFGLIPFDGALPFAPSLDTVGFFTQTAADMNELWSRGFGGRFDAQLHRAAALRVPADSCMQAAFARALERLRAAGVAIDELDPPDGWDELLAAARLINRYEGARTHRARYEEFGDRLGAQLAALLREGLMVPDEEYDGALAHIERMRAAISALHWEYPAILTPAAIGAAPEGLTGTGDPSPNAPWTALGVPAMAVPLPFEGAPMGIQITGAWGRDDALVAVGTQLESLLVGDATDE